MIKDASIEIIQRCANRCIHCSSCSGIECSTMLDCNTISSVLTGLKKLGASRICLSGGEPFLHPDIIEIIKCISDLNMIADIYTCGIVEEDGNSTALSRDLLTAAKNAGARSLIFNMQSTNEETYDYITQSKHHLPLLYESISNAIECNLDTEIHFVPMSCNIGDVIEVIEYAEKAGVKQVNFLKLVPHGRADKYRDEITPTDAALEVFCKEITGLINAGKHLRIGLPLSENDGKHPCHAVTGKIYIKFDGSVYGCEAFKYLCFKDEQSNRVLPDNIKTADIVDIYKTSAFLKKSMELVSIAADCMVDCENCPVQKIYRRIRKEK